MSAARVNTVGRSGGGMAWVYVRIGLLGLAACGGTLSEPDRAARPKADAKPDGVEQGRYEKEMKEEATGGAPAAPAPAPAPAVQAGRSLGSKGVPPPTPGDAPAEPAAEPDLRDWFPEAMLWAPEVVTGPDGRAVVPFTVPDSLTRWRLLAHAHTADGAIGGAEAGVISALPAWVDVVVPTWVTAGDVLQAGVLVAGSGADPVRGSVTVEASGAAQATGALSVDLQPGDRQLSPVRLAVGRPGDLSVRATLAGVDAVERHVAVLPAGRPVEHERGGVLADRATWAPTAWEGRLVGGDALEVWVLPGGLGVLRQELTRLADPSGSWGGGYAWQVAEHLGRLASGVDPEALKRLRMRAWQRLVRAVGGDAAAASEILLNVQPGPEADELRAMYLDVLLRAQRGDGAWGFQEEGSLQKVLLDTATASLSLPPDQEVARLRASDAISRMLPRLEDPLSAAIALGTGLLDPAMEPAALARVQAALVDNADGTVTFKLPLGLQGAAGGEPRPAEALTWAAAALQGRDDVALRKVVATLLAGYRPGVGLGAGRIDGLALRLIVAAMPPIDKDVSVTLRVDGAEVGRTVLSAADPGAPGRIVAAVSGAEATLVVDPPVPGLAWSVVERARLPWGDARAPAGTSVAISVPPAAVGRTVNVLMTVEAPGASTGQIRVGLPAGAVLAGEVSGVKQVGDALLVDVKRAGSGEARRYELPVRAAFAGTFQSAPHQVTLGGKEAWLPPSAWVVE